MVIPEADRHPNVHSYVDTSWTLTNLQLYYLLYALCGVFKHIITLPDQFWRFPGFLCFLQLDHVMGDESWNDKERD